MPTTLEHIQYGFDRDSRRTWKRRTPTTNEDDHYSYDALSQVTVAARGNLNLNLTAISGRPAIEQGWEYDPTGNWRGYGRNQNGLGQITQHRVHDRGNRLTQIENSDFPLILDRVGRVRQSAPDATGAWGGRLELEWDAWSRIVGVKSNSAVVGTYTYDGLHRRVTRLVSSVTWHSYFSDAWRPLEERKNAETTAALSYLWGARHRDDLVRRDRAASGTTLNETRYVLMDYFNASAITDATGVVKERYAYTAFGVRSILNPDYSVRSTSECAFEFGFQGQFLDSESGLMNYGYRLYSPYLGRWMCKDPIGIRGGANLYAYARNRSVNFVDRLGLLVCCPKGQWPDDYGNCCSECKIYVDVNQKDKCGVAGSCGEDDDDLEPVEEIRKAIPRTDCTDYVDSLVAAAQNNSARMFGRMGMALGMGLMSKTAGGIAAGNGLTTERNFPTGGFNENLTSGGQSGQMYQHIWGAMSLTMLGANSATAGAANIKMAQQLRTDFEDALGKGGYNRAEGSAEIQDDVAGIKAGNQLNDFFDGKITPDQLGAALRNIFCQ